MPGKPVLYGFSASTYVRTVRMLLAEKRIDYDQVDVNVLAGEPHSPEHLARHPFGKVPVLDVDGMRLYETAAILRYLDETRPAPSLVPLSAKDRARMAMACGIIDSYGYGSLIGGVAAYHLFPDFVGGRDDAKRAAGLETDRKVLAELMRLRGGDPWIAGGSLSHADILLAPIVAYVAMTPDAADLFAAEGFADWWGRMQALPSFRDTAPG